MYHQIPMTKEYCDLCKKLIRHERASVRIIAENCDFYSQTYCLPCFYLKSNWSKIHKTLKPRQPMTFSRMWAKLKTSH